MKGRVTLAFVLVACTTGTLQLTVAAPVPKEEAVLYYATRVGAKWVYKSGDGEHIEVVTEVREKYGAKLVTIGCETNGMVTPHQVLSVTSKGLNLPGGNVAGWQLNEPLWLLKLPHAPGNEWEAILEVAQFGRIEGVARAEGPVRVDVPAGTYKAIRVDMALQIDGRTGKPVPHSIWYAPGVGKVKRVLGDDTVEELKSFHPGKE